MLIIPFRSMRIVVFTAVVVAYWLAFLGISAAFALERPSGYKLRWSDEFSGSSLNTDKWRPQPYPSNQVSVRNGRLILRASGTNSGNVRHGGVRSGDTRHLNSWKGSTGAKKLFNAPGWLEIRFKASDVRGVMSEIVMWTDYQAWPAGSADRFVGEIDGTEVRGFELTKAWLSTHVWRYPNWTWPAIDDLQNNTAWISRAAFQTYVIHWSKDWVRIYVNGVLRHRRDMNGDEAPIFGFPFTITMSCWVVTSGGWGGEKGVDWSRLPTQAEVDYVRYYAP